MYSTYMLNEKMSGRSTYKIIRSIGVCYQQITVHIYCPPRVLIVQKYFNENYGSSSFLGRIHQMTWNKWDVLK